MVNFGEVRRVQVAKVILLTPHLHVGAPGSFSDLLRFVQTLKRECCAQSNGKLPYLIIHSKTAALFPKFAMEDLSLAEMQPWFLG